MSSIDKVPEYLKAIQEIQPLLIENLQSPVGFFITLAAFFWFILTRDYNIFFNLFERKTNKKIEQIDKYISNPDLADPGSLRVAKEQRDAHYFYISTNGIRAEKPLRTELIYLYENSSAAINWTIIKRSIRFLDISKEGVLFVKDKSTFDIIGFYYNKLTAILLILSAITLFLIQILFVEVSFIELITMLAKVSLCTVLSLFMVSQNFPLIAVNKIENELKNIKQNRHIYKDVPSIQVSKITEGIK